MTEIYLHSWVRACHTRLTCPLALLEGRKHDARRRLHARIVPRARSAVAVRRASVRVMPVVHAVRAAS